MSDCRIDSEHGVEAAFELAQAEAGGVERFGIGDGDAAVAGVFGDDGAEEAVEVESGFRLRISDCGLRIGTRIACNPQSAIRNPKSCAAI